MSEQVSAVYTDIRGDATFGRLRIDQDTPAATTTTTASAVSRTANPGTPEEPEWVDAELVLVEDEWLEVWPGDVFPLPEPCPCDVDDVEGIGVPDVEVVEGPAGLTGVSVKSAGLMPSRRQFVMVPFETSQVQS